MVRKDFWKSKTLWINFLVILGGVVTMLADHLAAGGTITALGVVNMILRVVTTSELSFK